MILEAIEKELRAVVGDEYASLDESDRVILMLAHRFGEVGNADIQPYCPDHPRDIGVRLRRFVAKGWLGKTGHTRGTRYRLPASAALDLFAGGGDVISSSGHFAVSSGHSEVASGHSVASHDTTIAGEQDALRQLAAPVRDKGRAPKELVEQIITSLCRARWLTLRELAELLGRDSEALRKHYITRLLRQGRLLPRYPHHPNHPEQAYQTSESANV
jgi:ATP-dependent DNA helicase RecG